MHTHTFNSSCVLKPKNHDKFLWLGRRRYCWALWPQMLCLRTRKLLNVHAWSLNVKVITSWRYAINYTLLLLPLTWRWVWCSSTHCAEDESQEDGETNWRHDVSGSGRQLFWLPSLTQTQLGANIYKNILYLTPSPTITVTPSQDCRTLCNVWEHKGGEDGNVPGGVNPFTAVYRPSKGSSGTLPWGQLLSYNLDGN